MFVLIPLWGAECPEACPAAGKGFDESELDSSLSQCAGADCRSVERPQKVPDFVENVAKDEAGVMSLGCLFDGLPHPAESLGLLRLWASVLSPLPSQLCLVCQGSLLRAGRLLTLQGRREFPPLRVHLRRGAGRSSAGTRHSVCLLA